MKKIFHWLLKAFIAGCAALVLLNGFAFLWYNVPVHYDNPTGATEYVWESHKFYSKGTEGFALGRTNNEGFNNIKDYNEGDRVDILLMGSSHTEGFNVAQDENMGAVINQLFEGEKYCYNIGTAGHTFLYCVSNLSDALDRYQPEEYLIIETFSVDFGKDELMSVVDGSLAPIPSHNGGIVGMLQKLPYLRLFYTQHFKNGGLAFDGAEAKPAAEAAEEDYLPALEKLLDMVAAQCSSHNVQPVIVYHNSVLINEDGSAYTGTDSEKLENFRRCCEDRGITFLDLCPRALELYEQEHQLLYGFSNTSPGSGHMNRLGHRIFAEEVVETVRETEG